MDSAPPPEATDPTAQPPAADVPGTHSPLRAGPAESRVEATRATPSPSAIADALARFFAIEAELGVGEIVLDGARAHDYLRVEIFDALLARLDLLDHKQPLPDRSALGYLRQSPRFAHSILTRDPFRQRPADVVVIGHPRRTRRADGTWEDSYVDPLLEGPEPALPSDRTLVLERPLMHRHATPPRTDALARLAYLDALAARACLRRIAARPPFTDREAAPLRELAARLRAEFGVTVPVIEFARRKLALRRAQLPVWRQLMTRLKPRVVPIVVSYGNEIPIEACQQLGIRTVELQHGVIAHHHLGYHFPPACGFRKRLFPESLLVFGDHWRDAAAFPLDRDRVISVGFARFDRDREAATRTAPRETKDGTRPVAVFLSQPAIGVPLSRLAAELATACRASGDAVRLRYKLHPGETDWRTRYPWLVEAPIEVVAEEPLYEVLAKATSQIGVYSTALFEGLGFGLGTAVVDLPGAEVMAPLIARGDAASIPPEAKIARTWLASSAATRDARPAGRFFRTGAKQRARDALLDPARV